MATNAAINSELVFPPSVDLDSSGMKVRRLQEWLTFHGCATTIDGGFGSATEKAINDFQRKSRLPISSALTQAVWAKLVAPLDRAVSALPAGQNRVTSILAVAKAHLAEHPIELGGENRGPWVRSYMSGRDGAEWLWCAGFVSTVMAQGCASAGQPMPVKGSVSCDTLAAQAQANGNFVAGKDIASGKVTWQDIGACSIFLVKRSPGDYSHTGFAFKGEGNTFYTIEGNTNDDGSSNGYEVCSRSRSIKDKDFITLLP